MRRIPVVPTILVALAVATMIGLGVWQLQRLAWKERLIADMSGAAAYVPVAVTCDIDTAPEVRAGRSTAGEIGYRYLVPCGSVRLDIGWSKRPDLLRHIRQQGSFAGQRLAGGVQSDVVILDMPIPPLARSELPKAADIPNNHLAYAGQWFFFAAAAAVIYVLALRRRNPGS